MLDYLSDRLRRLFQSRLFPLLLVFFALFLILIFRVFKMQIINGTASSTTDEYYDVQTRTIKSTRGRILDRNGNVLAYNESSYSVVMADSALLSGNTQKNAMIDKMVKILNSHGYPVELNFNIELNKKGELEFNVSGSALLRFKKNAYCLRSANDLTQEQLDATAQEVFDYLRYGDKQAPMFQIDESYTTEEALAIMTVRYAMLITPVKYTQITLASDVDDKTAAAVKENLADLPGVAVKLETSRVYNDSLYFSHILGYTGLINSNELEELNAKEERYEETDYVGKIGIEKEMESYLSGTKGTESVTINDSNKEISSTITTQPVVGNDVVLTIDHDLQVAAYNILEKNIAEVLLSKIVNSMDYGSKGESASKITVPVYEVYNALIANNVIDISKFRKKDASSLEKSVYEKFTQKRESVMNKLKSLMAIDSMTTNSAAGEEMQEYLEYMYSLLSSSETDVLISSAIDKTDAMYTDYKDSKISLSSFLQYAITKQWINLETIGLGDDYYSSDEIYKILLDYALNLLIDNDSFEKKIYRTLIFAKNLSGREICLLLYDQNVLEYNESDYNNLSSGKISAYSFITGKIRDLSITPGQLALEPCSGSIVLTDVKTGDVLALVTYPSYDNNKLANKIEWDYYQTLLNDKSAPLINRPTMQKTTTGSTFKPLMALAGLGEGVITTSTTIYDRVTFTEVVPSPSCWYAPHSHGLLNIAGAIQHSCNYFFYETGYRMMRDSSGNYSDSLGIQKIKNYAQQFGLAEKSGVEIEEATPEISTKDAIRTAIGYGHSFAPVQISRYITTVANRGTLFDYTLVDKVTENNGTLVYDNEAKISRELTDFTDAEWNIVQKGMNLVVNSSANGLDGLYKSLGVTVAGKTGTAQVSKNSPNHALFVAFAPYEDPKISMVCVIPNGYSSANAAKMGREVLGYYFNGENKEALLDGTITAGNATNINVSD